MTPPANLPPDAYADPRQKLFPLHTKAAVWASYAFFLDKKASLRPSDAEMIEDRIVRAGKFFGCSAALGALKVAVERDRPAADEELPDDDYALVWDNADGTRERHLPMRNSLEVKTAAEYLLKWRAHEGLTFADRRAVAEKIMAKAAAFGSALGELNEFIEKQAGYGMCTAEAAATLLEERAEASRRSGGPLTATQSELRKLAGIIRANPGQIRDADFRVKLAGVVDAFDREARLRPLVRDGILPAAEDVLFNVTRAKLAGVADEHVQAINGSVYRLADVERLKLASLKQALGDDVAEAFSADGFRVNADKAASAIPTLDRGAAVVFDRLMGAAGLAPVAKAAEATAVRFERNFLLELAKHHAAPAGA